MRAILWILSAVVLCVGIAALLLLLQPRPEPVSTTQPVASPLQPGIGSLAEAARRQRPYRYFVEDPAQTGQWIEALAVTETEVRLPDGTSVAHEQVRSWLVTYPNGEILQAHESFLPLPTGVSGLRIQKDRTLPTLTEADLTNGRAILAVQHSNFRPKGRRRGWYDHATTLTNHSATRLKVTHFAPYDNVNGRLEPGVRYSGEQFASWYGLSGSGWIEPGASVSDPDNYSTEGGVWVYFAVTESGDAVVSGATVAASARE